MWGGAVGGCGAAHDTVAVPPRSSSAIAAVVCVFCAEERWRVTVCAAIDVGIGHAEWQLHFLNLAELRERGGDTKNGLHGPHCVRPTSLQPPRTLAQALAP